MHVALINAQLTINSSNLCLIEVCDPINGSNFYDSNVMQARFEIIF